MCIINTDGIGYRQVCSRVMGYQHGTPDAFYPSLVGQTLNGYYVDGVSLTYNSTPHIKHVWTFAVANDEVVAYSSRSCECISPVNHNIPNLLTSIRYNYFCATNVCKGMHSTSTRSYGMAKAVGMWIHAVRWTTRLGSSRISISPPLMRWDESVQRWRPRWWRCCHWELWNLRSLTDTNLITS